MRKSTGKKMRNHRGRYRYQGWKLLKEFLFFTISLVVYFPLHIKNIISYFIFSKDYKAQNVHSLLEKEDFSFDCIIDLDTTLYERRDECYTTIPEYFCKELALHKEHHHYEGQTLDFSFWPKWLLAEKNNQSSHIQPQIEESNSEGICHVQRILHQQDVQEKEAVKIGLISSMIQ